MKFVYIGSPDLNGVSSLLNIGQDNVNIFTDTYSKQASEVSTLLPERRKLHHEHYEWLQDNDLIIVKDCTVNITFLTEGAGYRNAIGYYIYKTENPPSSLKEISTIYVLFPNLSFPGAGNMRTGDTMQLAFSLNTTDVGNITIGTPTEYTFRAGYSIGFCISANGWKGNDISRYSPIYTSMSSMNPERAQELKYHTAVYKSPSNPNVLVMGFEDINREASWCDHDFNDAVFVITPSDISAISEDSVCDREEVGEDHVVGYKKVFVDVKESGEDKIVEAVARLLIPPTSTIITGSKTGKCRTNKVTTSKIVGINPTMKLYNTATGNYAGHKFDVARSKYNKNFTYKVGEVSETVLEGTDGDLPGKGISYFATRREATRYGFDSF